MDRKAAYWFAVHARSRHEKQVDSFLKEKCIDSFLPLIKTLSGRRDKRVFVDLPLFPGYLFVNIPLDKGNSSMYRRVRKKFAEIASRAIDKMLSDDSCKPSAVVCSG